MIPIKLDKLQSQLIDRGFVEIDKKEDYEYSRLLKENWLLIIYKSKKIVFPNDPQLIQILKECFNTDSNPIKPNEYHFLPFIENYDSNILSEFVNHMMTKEEGENDWFEVKRGLPPQQLQKFSRMISALSNTGGGLIYYGWDEKINTFSDVDTDDLENKLLSQTGLTFPKILIEFKAINHNGIRGLFVGIPAMDKPVQDKRSNDWLIRIGGHKTTVKDALVISKTQSHLLNRQTGHLYLSKIKQIINKVIPKTLKSELKEWEDHFASLQECIITDIRKNWEIDFQDWYNSNPEFPIRVWYKAWKHNHKDGESYTLQQKVITDISIILEKLGKYSENDVLNIDFSKIVLLLRDLTKNETKNPTNHRRDLFTLISRQNIWNFSHTAISVYQNGNMFSLVQNTSGRNHSEELTKIIEYKKEIIEQTILGIIKDGYYKSVKQLFEDIFVELNSLIAQTVG
ncbi:MAG: ATP-binding protein [Candidatus Heimdallarchaeota archaeon]|nr:ATP-binding protein [Candidatus Heimdallarchaeota archaeon]